MKRLLHLSACLACIVIAGAVFASDSPPLQRTVPAAVTPKSKQTTVTPRKEVPSPPADAVEVGAGEGFSDESQADRLLHLFEGPLTWYRVLGFIAIYIVTLIGIPIACLKLFFETKIKESVKSDFDEQLADIKAALDLKVQRAFKDFGLFAEKKHEVNTAVYSALRTAYLRVNRAVRGMYEEVNTSLFTDAEFAEYLTSLDAPLDLRKSLGQLHQVSPEIAASELSKCILKLRVSRANQDVTAARELTHSSDLFLAPPVIDACDQAIALLSTALAKMIVNGPTEESEAALREVPLALAHVKIGMRRSLLGEENQPDDGSLVAREEDVLPPFLFGMRRSTPVTEIADFEVSMRQLVSRGSPPPVPSSNGDVAARGPTSATPSVSGKDTAYLSALKTRLAAIRTLLRENPEKALKEAEQLWQEYRDDPDCALLLVECRGRLPRSNMGELLEDIRLMDLYIAKHPNDPNALFFRGKAEFHSGLFAAAGEDLRAALAFASEKNPLKSLARAVLAELYRRGGEISKAMEEVDHALQDNPEISGAQLTRLELLASHNRWREIGLVSEQVLSSKPLPRAVQLIGEYLITVGRYPDAEELVQQFEQGSPVYTVALAVRARARYNLGKFDAALADANDALTQDSTNPDANLARAQSLAAKRHWDDATSAAKTAYRYVRPLDGGRVELLLEVLRTVHKAKHRSQQPPDVPILYMVRQAGARRTRVRI